ncbi:MAG: signal peptidase II [Propionibacteriaceae bacterium]|nr:signal peptidase II [Propionibacteriaceae bacterium]
MTAHGWGKKPLTWILSLVFVGVVVDQITKAMALARLVPGEPVSVISDYFQLDLLRNPGAAFSTGTGLTVVFSCLALVVLVGASVWVIPRVRCVPWAIAVGLGMAGVAGNFIDRMVRPPGPFRGYVVDFFSVKYFAVFNVADILLTTAALLILLFVLVFKLDITGQHLSAKTDSAGE